MTNSFITSDKDAKNLTESLQVQEKDGIQSISARELYKGLQISDRFSRWFESLLKYGFVENEDFTSVKSSTLVNNGAERELQNYELSVDMAKHICMVQRTEKAKQVRQYLIDLEKAWNTPEQIMARALKVAEHTITSLNQKVIEMKPKADFFDAVADSKTAISMNEVAKVLDVRGYGRNNLFEFLRNEGILDRFNRPYQRYVDCGWFRVIEQRYTKNGEETITTKTLVYQKGVDAIRKRLLDKIENDRPKCEKQ